MPQHQTPQPWGLFSPGADGLLGAQGPPVPILRVPGLGQLAPGPPPPADTAPVFYPIAEQYEEEGNSGSPARPPTPTQRPRRPLARNLCLRLGLIRPGLRLPEPVRRLTVCLIINYSPTSLLTSRLLIH